MTSLPLENNNNIFEILSNEFLIEIQQTCSSLTKASFSKDKLFFLKKLKQNLNKLPQTLDISLIYTISNQLCNTLLLLCQNKKYEIEIFEESLSLYLKLLSQMKRKNKLQMKQFIEGIILSYLSTDDFINTYGKIIIKQLACQNIFSFLVEMHLNFTNEKHFTNIIKILVSIIVNNNKRKETNEQKEHIKENAWVIITNLLNDIHNYCKDKLSLKLKTAFSFDEKEYSQNMNDSLTEHTMHSDGLISNNFRDNNYITKGLSKKDYAEFIYLNDVIDKYNSVFHFQNKSIFDALNEYFAIIEIDIDNSFLNKTDKYKLNKADFFLQSFALVYHQANSCDYKSVHDVYYLTSAIVFLHLKFINGYKCSFSDFMTLIEDIEISNDIISTIYYDVSKMYKNGDDTLVSQIPVVSSFDINCNYYISKDEYTINDITELIISIDDDIINLNEYIINNKASTQEQILQSINTLITLIKTATILNVPETKIKIISTLIKNISPLDNFITVPLTLDKDIPIIISLLKLLPTPNSTNSIIYCNDIWEELLHLIFNLSNVIFFKEIDNTKYNKETLKIISHNIDIISNEIREVSYKKVFSITNSFNCDTLINFISSLSNAIITTSTPKELLYQLLLEVANANVHRIQFICKMIWNKIFNCFMENVKSNNQDDKLEYALNIFRQLTEIYLNKEVIHNKNDLFLFEHDFFMPFYEIWTNTEDISIKEEVLTVIFRLIAQKGNELKSAWIIILKIYSSIYLINDNSINFRDKVIKSLEDITTNYFNEKFIVFYYDHYLNCLFKIAEKYPCDLYEIIDKLILKPLKENQIQAMLSIYVILILNNEETIRKQINEKLFFNIEYILSTCNKSVNLSYNFFVFIIEKIIIKIINESLEKRFFDNVENIIGNMLRVFEGYYHPHLNYMLFDSFIQCIPKLLNIYSSKNVSEITMEIAVNSLKMISTMKKLNNVNYLKSYINNIYLSIQALSLSKVVSPISSSFEQSPLFINKIFETLSDIITILDKVFESTLKKRLLDVNDIIRCIEQLRNILNYIREYNGNITERLSKCLSKIEYVSCNSCKVQNNTIKLLYQLLRSQLIESNNVWNGNNTYFYEILVKNSLAIMEWFVNISKKANLDNDITTNDDEKTEIEEWNYMKNELEVSLVKFVFPLLNDLSVYTKAKYRKDYMKIFVNMILCDMISIRKELKVMISKILINNNE